MSGFQAEPSQHLFDSYSGTGQGRLKGVVDAQGVEDYLPVFMLDATATQVVGMRMLKSGIVAPFPGADPTVSDISVANGGSATNTPTLNYASGRFTALAAATSVTISNSQVTALTKVFASLTTADSTGWIKNIVPGVGTITITFGAALTANANVDFHITL